MEERKKVRWAALALGSIASTFLKDLIGRAEAKFEHTLVSVSSTKKKDAAKKWLAEHDITGGDQVEVYTSWEEMLKDSSFDIVYISSPHPLHYQHVQAALKNKRNVLVEKPATMNAAQYRKCVELAERQGVVLMEAMWTRFVPATRYFKETLLPKIGTVKRVYSDFTFLIPDDLPSSHRILDKKAGAGALLDLGVYALTWVDLAFNGLDASDDLKVVHASSIPFEGIKGDVDNTNAVVLSKPGATAIVTTSYTLGGSRKSSIEHRGYAKKLAPSVRVEATNASVAIPYPLARPRELHVQWYGEGMTGEGGIEVDELIEEPVIDPLVPYGIWYQADAIAQAVVDGKPGVLLKEETLRVLGWMDKARELAGIKYDADLEET